METLACITSKIPPDLPICCSFFFLPLTVPHLETLGSHFLSRLSVAMVPSVRIRGQSYGAGTDDTALGTHVEVRCQWDQTHPGKQPLTHPETSLGPHPVPSFPQAALILMASRFTPHPTIRHHPEASGAPCCPPIQVAAHQLNIQGSAFSGLNLPI